MAKHVPLTFIAILAALALWAMWRSFFGKSAQDPSWPEATTEQLLAHLGVNAYWLVEGPYGEPFPVQLDFPTLRTTLHVTADFNMRMMTKGYSWRPVECTLLRHNVQTILLSN